MSLPTPPAADWELAWGLLENAWRAALTQALAGLSPAQFRALLYMRRHPNVTVGQVAGGLGISYPATTKLVRRLVQQGWVNRQPQPTDRREVVVDLTEAGRRRLEQATRARLQVLEQMLEPLGSVRQGELWRAVGELLEAALQVLPDRQAVCLACGEEARPQDCPLLRAGMPGGVCLPICR
ncbi:MAG: MarR family transcriptional regulator [Limnochordaceae bacterium]|nr:MarR family transcriptional regulator [Limnochordaceae bacterium]